MKMRKVNPGIYKPIEQGLFSGIWTIFRSFCMMSNMYMWRAFFVLFVCIAVVGLSLFANHSQKQENHRLAKSLFDSLVKQDLESVQRKISRIQSGLRSMSSIYGEMFPIAEEWPLVYMRGYEIVTSHILKTYGGTGLGVAPLVKPENLSKFEDFAYENFEAMGYPDEEVERDFGPGVWAVNTSISPYADGAYHSTTGDIFHAGDYRQLVPVLQYVGPAGLSTLLFDVYADKFHGQLLDTVSNCVNNAQMQKNSTDTGTVSISSASSSTANMSYCGQLGPIRDLGTNANSTVIPRASVMVEPIFANNDPSTPLVGFVMGSVRWDLFFDGVFFANGNKIELVFVDKMSGVSVTYTVKNGALEYIGDGDRHDPHFNRYKQSQTMYLESDGVASQPFDVHVYPTHEYFNSYSTSSEVTTPVGLSSVILTMLVLFLLYDFYVQKEFGVKKAVLEQKRRFVRFISHEVRTPLNTVWIGLKLLEDEWERLAMNNALSQEANTLRKRSRMSMASRSRSMSDEGMGGSAAESIVVVVPSADEECEDGNTNAAAFTAASTFQAKQPQQLQQQQAKWAISTSDVNEWQQLTQEIVANAKSAVQVLNDLISYDKIETGDITIDCAVVPMWQVIEESVRDIQILAAKCDVRLILDFSQLMLVPDDLVEENLMSDRAFALLQGGTGTGRGGGRAYDGAYDSTAADGEFLDTVSVVAQRNTPRSTAQSSNRSPRSDSSENAIPNINNNNNNNDRRRRSSSCSSWGLHGVIRDDDWGSTGAQGGKLRLFSLLPNKVLNAAVMGDQIRLEQVVKNLLAHSLKFTPANGEIRVTAQWIEPAPGMDAAALAAVALPSKGGAAAANVETANTAATARQEGGSLSSAAALSPTSMPPMVSLPSFSSSSPQEKRSCFSSNCFKSSSSSFGDEQGKLKHHTHHETTSTAYVTSYSNNNSNSSGSSSNSITNHHCDNRKVYQAPTERFTLTNGAVYDFEAAGYIRIIIQDTGDGMSAEHIQHLVDKGITFDDEDLHSHQGNGLGMYIVHRLVDRHRGSMHITSEGLNKGTTFIIILPLFDVSRCHYDAVLTRIEDEESVASCSASVASATSVDSMKPLPGQTPGSRHDKKTSVDYQADPLKHPIGSPPCQNPTVLHQNSSHDDNKQQQQQQNQQEKEEEEVEEKPRFTDLELGQLRRLQPHSLSEAPAAPERSTTINARLMKGWNYTIPPLRILVVDDSSPSRMMVLRLLRKRGHFCDDAINGQEAVNKIIGAMSAAVEEQLHYDCILMDYEMPVMDGPSATKIIKQKLNYKAVVIGVTGNVLPDDIIHFKSCGAEAVLPKPLKIENLESTWRQFHIGSGSAVESTSTSRSNSNRRDGGGRGGGGGDSAGTIRRGKDRGSDINNKSSSSSSTDVPFVRANVKSDMYSPPEPTTPITSGTTTSASRVATGGGQDGNQQQPLTQQAKRQQQTTDGISSYSNHAQENRHSVSCGSVSDPTAEKSTTNSNTAINNTDNANTSKASNSGDRSGHMHGTGLVPTVAFSHVLSAEDEVERSVNVVYDIGTTSSGLLGNMDAESR